MPLAISGHWGRVIQVLAVATAAATADVARSPGASPTLGSGPDTVVIQNGTLRLRALLWRPEGRGPFPAVLFNHGSGPAANPLLPERVALGPVFARHGYVFLYLFRRGSGLSANEGANSYDVMRQAFASKGQDAKNQVQIRLLENDDLSDAVAALAFLRERPEVDARRVALAGHSFGGSLTLILAERDTAVRAAVVFGAAAGSWPSSPPLQARLLAAVGHTRAPVFFIHAANDLSVAPGKALAGEMQRLGKPHRLEIYPASGRTPEEGHDFVHRDVRVWERDVFGFLDERMRR